MSVLESAAVVGLGLIGGSVARDLAARGVTVLAWDANPDHLDAARREGVVSHAMDPDLSSAGEADVIIIAVPVDAATEIVARLASRAGRARLITDVGSTKSGILAAAEAAGLGDRFVGSHPMAGDHRSGWPASRRGLFDGARVYLCPSHAASAGATALATAFWAELGAATSVVAAETHDRTLAWSSHLPHMLSAALALALARSGVARDDLGPGGRDVTRLAGSSPEVWTAIARDNAAAIDGALEAAAQEIAGMRQALRRDDDAELRARFTAARAWFGNSACHTA